MGIELELFGLLTLSVVAESANARFSLEIPVWKKVLKWLGLTVITLGLYAVVRHWALVFLVVLSVAGMTVHFVWCRRHGIDPMRATPLRKLYELQGWPWPEEYR